MLVFLLIFAVWASFAPINSSVIGNGEIILAANKKVISHLEGGIIKAIKITEGQFVKKNEELILLNTVQIKAKINQTSDHIKASEYKKSNFKTGIKYCRIIAKIKKQLLNTSA